MKSRKHYAWSLDRMLILWIGISAALTLRAQSNQADVTIHADQPGAAISTNLFGIFFEEINSAGDGGLYAELLRNRSFEASTNSIPYWTLVTSGSAAGQMSLDTSLPLSAANPQCLKLTMTGGVGAVGAANGGYWGIPLTAGATYNLGFYARAASGFGGALRVSLEGTNGVTYAQTNATGLTAGWQHFAVPLVPDATDPSARLALRLLQAGTVYLDFVSLFPAATFHGRTNGLRPDLADMLDNLRPSFVRFPGGSWVDGMSLSNAYHWEPTVGDPANRTERANIWGYMVGNGLGYEEYLQMCEDLGATPLFCINVGMDVHQNAVPTSQLGPWVQEALDAIQFANGDTNTYWGAQRAADGHPAPFHLRYVEIGNENGGAAYNANYAMFYDAIKSNYPDMRLIADNWGGIPGSRPVEIMDEHFYNSPAWFEQNAGLFDNASRTGPKVFVGEYAATAGVGNGDLTGALGEAAFMTGLERNSDVVEMASYAPLFANLNNKDWNPDLIYFNGTQVYGTPSYYVQQMFSLNRGDMGLPTDVTFSSNVAPTPHGAVGLGSWNTSVQYTNIVVTSNGVTLYQSDFTSDAPGWRVYNGAWSAGGGLYQQTAITTDCRSTTGDTNWSNYTLTLQARKVGGNEGFLILFNWLDDNHWTWWNIGGWNNTLDGIEQMVNGGKSLVGSQVTSDIPIRTNQWYDIRIVLTGPRIQCYLDGQLVHDVTYPNPAGLFVSSSYARSGGDVIVKAVNPYGQPVATTFQINGVNSVAPAAALIQLTGNPADENSLADPTSVFPVTNAISNAGTNFSLTLPAYSLSVLRLATGGLNTFTNLQLQIPSPINTGQSAPATLWGWKTGSASPVNLATNASHAIAWSSADPGVAAVDAGGKVTGVGPGVTVITATYGSLGLDATQSVQVVGQPLSMVHRYSFSEPSGSASVADSAGGPAWNGALPNGGTFANGQLTLASGSRQYVQLPAGILSNYPAVTIESWVTFPDQLPVNCFFYGFGNTDAGGAGEDYIFCAPQGGRIAITAADPGYDGEQNAAGAGDLSYHTNLHFVAVYDPPARYLALYTNGALAALNNAVTTSMSSVTDVLNYVGRSLYNVDPYPDLTLDEFRIYDGALTPREIAATQALGPDQPLTFVVPVPDAAVSSGHLTLSWPLAAAACTLLTRTNLVSGAWTPVSPAPQIVGNLWQVILPDSDGAQFFRLQE